MIYEYGYIHTLSENLSKEVKKENIERLVGYIREQSKKVEYDKLKLEADSRVNSKLRKYSKGTELMGGAGYYHPSIITPLITNNIKRGRLVRKAGYYDYEYDYDSEGNLIRIRYVPTAEETYYLENENMKIFITYRNCNYEERREIYQTVFAEYQAGGELLSVVDITWDLKMEDIVAFRLERYGELLCNIQSCRVLDILMSVWCERGMVTDYMVDLIYDENGKVIDYRVSNDSKHSIELQ